jgi:hypothetical protein
MMEENKMDRKKKKRKRVHLHMFGDSRWIENGWKEKNNLPFAYLKRKKIDNYVIYFLTFYF